MTYDAWKATDSLGDEAAGDLSSAFDCNRCDDYPPAEAYVCRDCGVAETEHPFPITGCRCIAEAHLCKGCLEKPKKPPERELDR